MKKVYFAGSIRGGRQDADMYKRIIEYIQRNHIVLTEHVGDLSKSKAIDDILRWCNNQITEHLYKMQLIDYQEYEKIWLGRWHKIDVTEQVSKR